MVQCSEVYTDMQVQKNKVINNAKLFIVFIMIITFDKYKKLKLM